MPTSFPGTLLLFGFERSNCILFACVGGLALEHPSAHLFPGALFEHPNTHIFGYASNGHFNFSLGLFLGLQSIQLHTPRGLVHPSVLVLHPTASSYPRFFFFPLAASNCIAFPPTLHSSDLVCVLCIQLYWLLNLYCPNFAVFVLQHCCTSRFSSVHPTCIPPPFFSPFSETLAFLENSPKVLL